MGKSSQYCASQCSSSPSRLFSRHVRLRSAQCGRNGGDSLDEPGLSRLALQALLHPTTVPEELRGPMSCVGQSGFRSMGHEALEQFAEGMIIIGILNPSTTDTACTSLI